jgi:hypothetical protein
MSKETFKCVISGKIIPDERVEALKMLGIPENRWTCVEHSTVKPKKGLYLGEVGTSELLMVDKVYDDSVRSVFKNEARSAAHEEVAEDDEEDNAETAYNAKELNYYISPDDQTDAEEEAKIIKRGGL